MTETQKLAHNIFTTFKGLITMQDAWRQAKESLKMTKEMYLQMHK